MGASRGHCGRAHREIVGRRTLVRIQNDPLANRGAPMKEMIYAGKHKFEWREGRDPRIQGDRQAIVRPIAATACDFDRRILSGLTPFEPPFAIGHEAVGEVVEVGGSVKRHRCHSMGHILRRMRDVQCRAFGAVLLLRAQRYVRGSDRWTLWRTILRPSPSPLC